MHDEVCRRREEAGSPDQMLRDPDPLVLDLAVNLAANAIGAAVIKIGALAYQRVTQRSAKAVERPEGVAETLREHTARLSGIVADAESLLSRTARRQLGGKLLLDAERLTEYHRLRDECFAVVREIDSLIERHVPADGLSVVGKPASPIFVRLLSRSEFVRKNLRSAQTASTATEAFLAIRASVAAMQDILQDLTSE